MLVSFKRDWFSPAGVLSRVKDNPHNIPDDLLDALPENADQQGKAKVPTKKELDEAQERRNIADPMKKEVADVMIAQPGPASEAKKKSL